MIILYLNKPQIDPEWFLQAFVTFIFMYQTHYIYNVHI